MTLVAHYNRNIGTSDGCENNILNEYLYEKIYMKQLEGFTKRGKESWACKPRKSICDFKQAFE